MFRVERNERTLEGSVRRGVWVVVWRGMLRCARDFWTDDR
jgi:hypothetical protein